MRFHASIVALIFTILASGVDVSHAEPQSEQSRREGREPLCASVPSASLRELNWSLPPLGSRIEGSTLIAELAPDSPTNAVHCEAPLDLSGLLGDNRGLILTIRLRAKDVTKPAHEWNGVKFMLRYEDAGTGRTHYPGASAPIGTYGWRTVTNRVNILTAPVNPVDGRATLVLGLQESTGRVEFDLDSLTLATEDVGVSPVNQDWIVRYPEGAPAAQMKGATTQQMKGAATQQMKGAATHPSFAA